MKFRHLVLASMAVATLAACVGDDVDSSVARHEFAESTAERPKRADAAINIRDLKDNYDLASKTLAMKSALLGGDPVEMANLVRDYKDLLDKDAAYGDAASNAAYSELKTACDKDELCAAEVTEPGAADRIREERKKAKEEEEKKQRAASGSSVRTGGASSSGRTAPSVKENGSTAIRNLDENLNETLRLSMTYGVLPSSNLALELGERLGPGESLGRGAKDNAYVNISGRAAFLGLASRDGKIELVKTDFLTGHMRAMSNFDARLGAEATYKGVAVLPDLSGAEAESRAGALTYTIDTARRRGSGLVEGLSPEGGHGAGPAATILLEPAIFRPTPVAELGGLADGSPNDAIAAKGEASVAGVATKHPYVMTISKDGRAIAGAVERPGSNPILMYGDKQQ